MIGNFLLYGDSCRFFNEAAIITSVLSVVIPRYTLRCKAMSEASRKYTTVKVSKGNVERLKRIGRKGETYNDIIGLLLDHKPKRFRPVKS